MNEFSTTKAIELSQLLSEIKGSAITIAIASLMTDDGTTNIIFKTDLSDAEVIMLDAIIDAHIPIEVPPEAVQVSIGVKTDSDDIPYVYPTSKPLNHYVCFQGADDMVPANRVDQLVPHFNTPAIASMGNGKKVIFAIKSNEKSITKEFAFSENVYVKDGYIIVKGAPMGACFDIEIIHPVYGLLFPFGKRVPLMGDGWFPMDTEDRGYLPMGLKLRITVYNSQFIDAEDDGEEAPTDFFLSGRFELYRPKPPGT